MTPTFLELSLDGRLTRSRRDYTGHRIGKLTAVRMRHPVLYGDDKSIYWVWMCDCGEHIETTRTQLKQRHKWFQRTGRSVACHSCIGQEIRALGLVDKRPRHCRVSQCST